ncbi:hypothetical protein SNE40_002736 [Patella caerulea]|uniref:Uncharacterized protein n=1 Tax=Patella caerulea TaxID=87958 RepID=A0AAN8Q052_PATCE
MCANQKSVSWITSSVLDALKCRRRAERKWRKTKPKIDRQLFNPVRNDTNKLVNRTKADHYNRLIVDNVDIPKALFGTLNALLGKTQNVPYPKEGDLNSANILNTLFSIDKINKIHSGLNPVFDSICCIRLLECTL